MRKGAASFILRTQETGGLFSITVPLVTLLTFPSGTMKPPLSKSGGHFAHQGIVRFKIISSSFPAAMLRGLSGRFSRAMTRSGSR